MSEIRLVNLRKEFKDVIAVRDVTITFPTASVTCLLGPSGCGKTTMMRMIAGLESPTAGDVYFDNDLVTEVPASKRKIGMVFQYPVVYRGISVYKNIELPLIEEKLPTSERKKRIDEVLEVLNLQDSVNKDITQLDNGTRQKVAIARSVARQPKIILFDEPITNVDAEAKVQLKRALKELTKQLKQTILYVTHDQTEAMTLADRIALMKDGAIIQFDAPRKLYNQPDDVFGGWFLGNPGMNFFEYDIISENSGYHLTSPLFPAPLKVSDGFGKQRVTIGIRPEKIQVGGERTKMSVRGNVTRKFRVVGGQYLLTVKVEDSFLKAKVNPLIGGRVKDEVWVECPLEWITVFGPDGRRLETALEI